MMEVLIHWCMDMMTCRQSRVCGRVARVSALVAMCVMLCMQGIAQTTHAESSANQSAASGDNPLEQARRVLATPQWKDAEAIIRGYLKQNPDSADAHALMGLILYRLHQPRASMAELVAASETGDLSAFDLRIFAMDCAAIPDFPEAEKWLVRSIVKDDRDAATWEALGHVRFAQQHYQDAIDALEHALALAPHSVSAETLIGLSNERLAHLDSAQAAYRQAIEWQAGSRDRDPVPLVGIGRVLLANNQPEDAITWLQRAAASPQASAEAHELLGLAYQKTGRTAEAVKALQTAIQLEPADARLHLMLARAYRAAGEKEKADHEQAEYSRLKASSTP
ncbi:MAG: tetratricopeptide repeat protein [Terracidiphilus sp.]|nr:tetratricopeptide repeat protein [Terracidiphilus sp.]